MESPVKKTIFCRGGLFAAILHFCLVALFTSAVHAQTNLIPNPGFTDSKNPLLGWRTAFPYEGWYVDNVKYVKTAVMNGKSCIVIDLPPGIAGNQGGKIESAFIKTEPGATYRVEIDCMTWDFGAKLHAEAWTHDSKPVGKPDKFRVPAAEDHPALVMCYRAQVPDPPDKSRKWSTVSREFTVPETVVVAGEEQKPEYLSLKAVVYAGTMEGGKSYFTNFRLTKIK
jgi:hypothetical protein